VTIRWWLSGLALSIALPAYMGLSTELPLAAQWALVLGQAPESYEEVLFAYSVAPRAAMALVAGAAFGLAGSLLQQVTQNRLVSPLTVGTSSGAWLALVVGAVVAPELAATERLWFSMAGAVLATAAVLAIAGRRGIGGLPVVLAGMAMNILLGAVATVVVLLNEQYVRSIFVWGAGDLTQTDWSWVLWLAPQVGFGLVAGVALRRPLTLMRLGADAARARGLAIWPFLLAILLIALWMTSSAITAIGVIGFIGLIAPNLARMVGARTALHELALSAVLGAILLLVTDGIAVWASMYTRDLVPSGASAALIGVPALIWLGLRRLQARDHAALQMPDGAHRLGPAKVAVVGIAVAALVVLALGVAPTAAGWGFGWPAEVIFSLRWPRVLSAAAAGAGMAISGVVLQRLLRNPLASPDVIGISSGATLALVGTVVVFGGTVADAGAPVALLGGLAVLAVLVVLGQRQGNAPGAVALVGISLAALLDAVLQFALAKGGEETYMIVGWLAGSTFRVSAEQAVVLVAGVAVLLAGCLALTRWLTLLSAGDAVAASRGLAVGRAKLVLLGLGAVTAAAVTAIVGPVAFVGLIAPHLAVILGAKRTREHLLLAAALGAGLMILSDWLGRALFYPIQLPAGATASIIGGTYFALLLMRGRIRRGVVAV